MHKIFLFFLVVFCLAACKPGVPDNVMKPEKMHDVLVDIHIVDGYLTTMVSQDSARNAGARYYKGVYKKFEIDSATYNRSLNYYYKHPEEMQAIYKEVMATLQHKMDVETKPVKKNAVPR